MVSGFGCCLDFDIARFLVLAFCLFGDLGTCRFGFAVLGFCWNLGLTFRVDVKCFYVFEFRFVWVWVVSSFFDFRIFQVRLNFGLIAET